MLSAIVASSTFAGLIGGKVVHKLFLVAAARSSTSTSFLSVPGSFAIELELLDDHRALDVLVPTVVVVVATSATVSVSWGTENATAVEIALDTAAPTGLGASGSTDVAVPCDGAPYAITITPQSDSGPASRRPERVESG